MSLDFLAPRAPRAVARSPMEPLLRSAGARFELRDGWNVAVAFGGAGAGAVAEVGAGAGAGVVARTVGWADVSHLRKLELQATPEQLDGTRNLNLGDAVRHAGAWWCRLTATRALVVGAVDEIPGAAEDVPGALDVTCNFAALTLVGPMARETIARFCALDLRPSVAPVGALRPGSIARQPGIVICEAPDRYLLLFGWAIGEYMWAVVADAGQRLGGGPIGVDALAPIDAHSPAETADA